MPRVLNKRRDPITGHDVYIGRGSPWGNPFKIGPDGDRDEVCDRFEREVLPTLDLTPLIGKNLVCFCAPQRCHGDSILAALRNVVGTERVVVAPDGTEYTNATAFERVRTQRALGNRVFAKVTIRPTPKDDTNA